jgi:type I restriction enzyme S subunit
MAEVGRARAAVQAQLETAHALPVALLRDVFNNSEEKAWSRKRISELRSSGVLIEHQDGNHGELHPRNKDFIAVGVKFVTAKHVQDDGRIALEQAPHISSIQANGLRIGFAQRCDVLLAHNATVGLVGQAPDNCEPFIVGTSLTIYRPEPKYLLPDFLFFALQSEEFQKQLFDAMKQTTRNQVPITRQRDLRLPLPPLMEQHRIATRLKSEFSAARSLVETLETRLAEIELLPAALLREAFNGKN